MKYPLIASGLVLIGVAACAVSEMPEPPEGQALYAENCAMCHGPAGKGDGWAGKDLRPRPSDLTRIEKRHKGLFPKAKMLSVIDGYTRVEMPGQDMPEFGLLLRGETVPVDVGDGVMTPTPRPLAALLVYLESIQEK